MIVSAMNLKGGVGKTTTAMSLATLATREDKDVEVYDCDPQSSASFWALLADQNNDPLPFPVRTRTSGFSSTAHRTVTSWTRRLKRLIS